jgi:polar amino acid transport system substrate-binding protein
MIRRTALLFGCLALAVSLGIAEAAPSREVQHTLAPTGALRVGVYRGSPSSIIEGATPADAKGVGYDLGRALAANLGVPFQAVIFPANEPLLEATAAGDVDVVFTNATAERAKKLDFSKTFMDVAKSFLVPAGSPLTQLADFKRPGLHVGVSQGSSTAEELSPIYPQLAIEPVATLKLAGEMLAAHKIEAFATNDAILYQMSDGVPGSHVIAGQWGLEHFGAAIPKGRAQAMPFLQEFMDHASADGTVARAVERSGLRGTVPAG